MGDAKIDPKGAKCTFCGKLLDLNGISIKEIQKYGGVSCPACAKVNPWKGPIAPPR